MDLKGKTIEMSMSQNEILEFKTNACLAYEFIKKIKRETSTKAQFALGSLGHGSTGLN